MKALSRGWIAYFIICSVFGFVGFYIYGSSAQVAATANVGLDTSLQPNAKAREFLIPMYVLMISRCQLAQVPVSRPSCDLINQFLGRIQMSGSGGFQAFLTAVPVFFVLGCSSYLLLDCLALLESLGGGSVMILNGFIFPGIVYMKLGNQVGFKQVVARFAIGLGISLSFVVFWKQFA